MAGSAVLRAFFISLSESRSLRALAERSSIGQRTSSRFVAGTQVEDAVRVTQNLNRAVLSVSIDNLGENVTTPEDALVMIRPTGVRLVPGGSPEKHLSGRVSDVAFRGRGYEHAIDINGTTRLTGVFADVRAKRGEIVGLRMDPADCHLFSVEP